MFRPCVEGMTNKNKINSQGFLAFAFHSALLFELERRVQLLTGRTFRFPLRFFQKFYLNRDLMGECSIEFLASIFPKNRIETMKVFNLFKILP